jgi:hypothetical protein
VSLTYAQRLLTPCQRTLSLVMAAGLALGALAGCAAPERVVVHERVVERVLVPAAQLRVVPAPIREDRGPAPGPGWNWVSGHWRWAGDDWAWTSGHWVQQVVALQPPIIVEQITLAPSPRHFWVPGHWVWRSDNSGWLWVKGAWHG